MNNILRSRPTVVGMHPITNKYTQDKYHVNSERDRENLGYLEYSGFFGIVT